MLAPSCALGANNGVTIIPSAAAKACAVPYAGGLIASPPTPLSSPLRRWTTDTALTVPPPRGKSATILPWIGSSVRSGNTNMIGNG
jgi:hypothetical protein